MSGLVAVEFSDGQTALLRRLFRQALLASAFIAGLVFLFEVFAISHDWKAAVLKAIFGPTFVFSEIGFALFISIFARRKIHVRIGVFAFKGLLWSCMMLVMIYNTDKTPESLLVTLAIGGSVFGFLMFATDWLMGGDVIEKMRLTVRQKA